MDKKCLGCGALLQYYNNSLEGFIDESKYETATICERCFRIKNYGEYKRVIKDNNTFLNILKDIVIPGSLPGVLTGVRLAIGMGWMSVI